MKNYDTEKTEKKEKKRERLVLLHVEMSWVESKPFCTL